MKRNNYSLPIPGKISLNIIIYGLFAVLCQLIFMILHINILLSSYTPGYIMYTYVPNFESPLMSIAIIIGGAFLIDYTIIRSEN